MLQMLQIKKKKQKQIKWLNGLVVIMNGKFFLTCFTPTFHLHTL